MKKYTLKDRVLSVFLAAVMMTTVSAQALEEYDAVDYFDETLYASGRGADDAALLGDEIEIVHDDHSEDDVWDGGNDTYVGTSDAEDELFIDEQTVDFDEDEPIGSASDNDGGLSDADEAEAADTVLAQRTLTARIEDSVLFDFGGDSTSAVEQVSTFWQHYLGHEPMASLEGGLFADDDSISEEDQPLTIEVSGLLPGNVSAVAELIEYDGEEIYSEEALASIELRLEDENGVAYKPESKVTVAIGGTVIEEALEEEQSLLLYAYKEDKDREDEKKPEDYKASARVYRDLEEDEGKTRKEIRERLHYETGREEDDLVFTEDKAGLTKDEKEKTISFQTKKASLDLILSALQPERTLTDSTWDGAASLTLDGMFSDDTDAYLTRLDASDYGDALAAEGQAKLAYEVYVVSEAAGEYTPDRPVSVAISDASLEELIAEASASDGDGDATDASGLKLWSVDGQGKAALVKDAVFKGDTVSFESDRLGIFVVTAERPEAADDALDDELTGSLIEGEESEQDEADATFAEVENETGEEALASEDAVELPLTELFAETTTEKASLEMETETEMTTEEITEAETESVTEEATEAVTEEEIETETETEEVTEEITEAATESESETETETEEVTEEITEAATEEETVSWRTLQADADDGDTVLTISGELPESAQAEIAYVDTDMHDIQAQGEMLLACDVSLMQTAVNQDGRSDRYLPDIRDAETQTEIDVQTVLDEQTYAQQVSSPVMVELKDPSIEEALSDGDELELWSIDEDGEMEIVEEAVFNGDTVSFETDILQSYAVINTVFEKEMTASDGRTYHITVTYDQNANIPAGAELDVSEITQEDDAASYDEYLEETARALHVFTSSVSYARMFDISIVKDGQKVELEAPVDVRITMQEQEQGKDQEGNVSVVHFGDEVQTLDCAAEGEDIVFTTDSFSVYVVAYTVDFHWGEYTYSIAGEDSILLSELLKELGVTEITIDDVENVTYSDPGLVEVEGQINDWLLKSVAPFDTEETLTLTLTNGQSVGIRVTDDQVTVTANGELTYNGTPQQLVMVSDEGDATLSFASGEDDKTAPTDTEEESKWSADIPTASDAGTYYVWYKIGESEPACITVTIEPKPATVTANSFYKRKDDPDPTFTATAEGLLGEDTLTYTLSRTNGEEAGVYDIILSGEKSQGNYVVTYVPGKLTITDITVIWKDGDGYVLETDNNVGYGTIPTYDGTEPYKAPSANVPLYTFIGWDPEPAAIEGDITYNSTLIYTAQFTGAAVGIHVYDKSSATQQGISGAIFTLTNKDGIVVWQGTTGSNGNLYIEEVTSEPTVSVTGNGGGAKFEVGSSYTLKQTKTDKEYFCPQGSWTLKVSEELDKEKTKKVFSLDVVKAPTDLSTLQPMKSGISFYIPNERVAKLTYITKKPDGTVEKTETENLGFLSYAGQYQITKDDLIDNTGNYEFVGWADANNEIVKNGDTLKQLNTVSIKEYLLTATWRIPLKLSVYTYSGGDIKSATLVNGSEGTFNLVGEIGASYSAMEVFGKAYDNDAARTITNNNNYGLTLAKITNTSTPDKAVSVTAMSYDSAAHAWKYRDSSNTWYDLAVGDKLSLYYTSNTLDVVWIKEENGTLSILDESKFPKRSFIVGTNRWYTPNDLFGSEQAKLEAIVEGNYYFQYYIMSTDDPAREPLARSADFQLINSEQGFQYRADADGETKNLPSLTTLYLVYAETPPEGSVRMDIENLTDSQFRLRELQVANVDILPTHRAIIETDKGLKIFDGVTSWTDGKHAGLTLDANTTARLVLLDAAEKKYTLDGVFETNLGNISYGDGSMDSGTVKRSMLSEYQITQTTRSATTGTLDSHAGKTIISFSDEPENTFTINKAWSEDVNKSVMRTTYSIYEIGLNGKETWPTSIPLTDAASEDTVLEALRAQDYTVLKVSRAGDDYTISNSNNWKRTYENLPPLADRRYFAIETSVTKNGVEGLENYSRAYTITADAVSETVTNTRNDNICRVDDQEFKTLKDAIKYITEKNSTTATIEILQEYVIPEDDAVTIPKGYDITLTTATNVDGLTTAVLYRGFSGALDMIAVKGALTISNLTLNGKVPSNSDRSGNSGNGGLVHVLGGATLTVADGATLQNGQAANGSAIFADNGEENALTRVVFTGGTVKNNYAENGGAVGVGGLNTRIELSGDVTIYNNHRTNNGNQFNLYLDQDSDEIIRVTGNGLGSDAHIGVYVTGVTNEGDPWKEHGRPAKTFATYADGADKNLNAFTNDRFTGNGVNLNRGHASTLDDYAKKVVWGETFSFTVDIQWLDADYQQIPAPEDASVNLSLRLPAGSTTHADDSTTVTGGTYTFDGLARYNTNGTPCEYAVSETSVSPEDYAQIFFYGDRGVANGSSYEVSGVYKDNKYKNNLVYSVAAGDGQHVVISNRYKYTTFTVTKKVTNLPDESTELNSRFTLMQVPKYGVGSANDLPNGLRRMEVPETWESAPTTAGDATVTLALTTYFFTLYGGNNWYCQVKEETATAEAMQAGIDSYAASGKGLVKFHAYHDITRETTFTAWERGDVKYNGETYTVYDGSVWHELTYVKDAQRPDVDIHYDHQDGVNGAESAGNAYGATSSGKSCTITTIGNGEATYTFNIENKDELSSDYIFYAKETGTNLPYGRGISGSDKLIAAYNPVYDYDQVNKTVTVTNTWRSVLTVEKKWAGDANQGTCVFDLYKLTSTDDSALTRDFLTNAATFKALVENGEKADLGGITVQKLDRTFSLRDGEGDGRKDSWVHAVTEAELGEPYDENALYFARERTVNGIEVSKHAVDETNNPDATYKYEEDTNLLVVTNLGAILCKVVDDDGTENVFRTLREAYKYGTTRTGGSQDEFTIQMLRDYDYPNDDRLEIEAGKKVTLTTASTVQTDSCKFVYAPPADDPEKTRATITRGEKKGSYILLNDSVNTPDSTKLTLKNIEFDGNGTAVSGNGAFVYAKNATVEMTGTSLENGVSMKNAIADNGGAIYMETGDLTLEYAAFEGCKSLSANNEAYGGGAIYSKGEKLEIKNASFIKCEANSCGGAVYHNNAKAAETKISQCVFKQCSTSSNTGSTGGGAVDSRALRLTITGTESNYTLFEDCSSARSGGGVFHNNNGVSTSYLEYCKFERCTTTSSADKEATGGLLSKAKHLNMIGCQFVSCSGYKQGGAVHQYRTDAGSTLRVEGCSFRNCRAIGNDSAAGAMESDVYTIEIINTEFYKCNAGSNGGAVNIYAGNSNNKNDATTVTINGCTFTDCYITTVTDKRGGGVRSTAKETYIINCDFIKSDDENAPGCTGVSGGGVYSENSNDGSKTVIQGCLFDGCEATVACGGGVYTKSRTVQVEAFTGIDVKTGNRIVRKTEFKNCTAKNSGGGLYHDNSSGNKVTIADCSFDNCKTLSSGNKFGGGVYTNAVEVEVRRTTFMNCLAVSNGGGLYYSNTNGKLIVEDDISFINCISSGGSGGGIWTSAKYIGTTNGTDSVPIKATFNNCKAESGDGGGMNVENSASVIKMEDCTFEECTATGDGGGLRSNGQTFTATRCTFTDCEKKGTGSTGGGGIALTKGDGGTTTWLKGCTFTGCISSKAGGGVYTANRTLTIGKDEDGDTPTTFTGCQANNEQGGAIRQNKDTADSSATLTECAIKECTATGNGGGMSTGVKTVSLTKSTFTDCTAGGAGGGLYSTYGGEGGATTLTGCAFTNCESKSNDGGAVYCATRALTAEDYVEGETLISNTFTNCVAKKDGGGIRHNQSNGMTTKLANCAFTACVSEEGNGGAVVTNVKTLDMDNCIVKDCHASNWGGGVNHTNNGTTTTVTGGSFENCYVSQNEGGGLRSNAQSANLTGVTFTNCHSDGTAGTGGGGFSYGEDKDNGTATVSGCTFMGCYCHQDKNGGAILFRDKTLIVEGTTIDGTISAEGVSYNANNGGGIYSSRGEVKIKAKPVEKDGEQTLKSSEIKNCVARTSGGGLYQNSTNNRAVEITNASFTGNKALGTTNETGGGAICFRALNVLTLDGCTIFGNSAGSYGGGVYYYYSGNDTNYNASKQFIMKNGTAITGNTLTGGAVENGAGVYLRDGTTLALGSDEDESDEDILTIYNNTAGSEASNLRMQVMKLNNKNQNMISASQPDILLYSNLKLSEDKSLGWIGVCTPGEEGTQFGLADAQDRTNMAYFVSDDGNLIGKLNSDGKKIVWYAPPVCQITDANGKLLKYGPNSLDATFSSLKAAYEAFNTLEANYFKDENRSVIPVQIQMLRSSYVLDEKLPALNRSGTLTTEANTPTCTITRGENLGTYMFNVAPGIEMNVARIVLDGGAKYDEEGKNIGLSAGTDGGIIWADQGSSLVLSQQAELRNSASSGNGGAVYLHGGASMVMQWDAVISNCSADGDGGAIYVASGASMTTKQSPTIESCHASRRGGAVFVSAAATLNLGTSSEVAPTIANNTSDGDGAGIYLFGTTSKLNIQGGINFSNNKKKEIINKTNGGEDYTQPRQDIYLQYNNKTSAPNINVTGEIVADAGSIWVWAYHSSHYLLDMQFAVIQDGVTVSSGTCKAFRDAVDDTTAENQYGQYYTGVKGAEDEKSYVYWGVPRTLDITVEKKWVIDNDPTISLKSADKASATFKLHQMVQSADGNWSETGVVKVNEANTFKVDNANGWRQIIYDLPMMDDEDNLYGYYVTETGVAVDEEVYLAASERYASIRYGENETAKGRESRLITKNSNSKRIQVTNRIFTIPSKTEFVVTKQWDDEEDHDNLVIDVAVYHVTNPNTGYATGEGVSVPSVFQLSDDYTPVGLKYLNDTVNHSDGNEAMPAVTVPEKNGFFPYEDTNGNTQWAIVIKDINSLNLHQYRQGSVFQPYQLLKYSGRVLTEQHLEYDADGNGQINYGQIRFKSDTDIKDKYFILGDIVVWGDGVWVYAAAATDGKANTPGKDNVFYRLGLASKLSTSDGGGTVVIDRYPTQSDAEAEQANLIKEKGYVVEQFQNPNASTEGTTGGYYTLTKENNWTRKITALTSGEYYAIEVNVRDTADDNKSVLSNYVVTYEYSQDGRNVTIKNTESDGVDIGFRKIDGFGKPLKNAFFSLYSSRSDALDPEGKTPVTVTVTTTASADASGTDQDSFGSAVSSGEEGTDDQKDDSEKTTTKETTEVSSDSEGRVRFTVPAGIYYMRETKSADASKYEENENVYVILAGSEYMNAETLTDVTSTNLFAGIDEGKLQNALDLQNKANSYAFDKPETINEGNIPDKNYAVFCLDASDPYRRVMLEIETLSSSEEGEITSVTCAQPDVVNYGLLNVSKAERKVILKKTDVSYSPLQGAEFTLYAADWTAYNFGKDSGFVSSGDSGVFFIGQLPLGIYYLKEIHAPSQDGKDYGANVGKYFKLTVDTEGITIDPTDASGAMYDEKDIKKKQVVWTSGGGITVSVGNNGGNTGDNSGNEEQNNPVVTETYSIEGLGSSYYEGDTASLTLKRTTTTEVNGTVTTNTVSVSDVAWTVDNSGAVTINGNSITFGRVTDATTVIFTPLINGSSIDVSASARVLPNTYAIVGLNASYVGGETAILQLSKNGKNISASKWESSDANIASVSDDLITFADVDSEVTVKITGYDGDENHKAEKIITVRPNTDVITVVCSNTTLSVNEHVLLEDISLSYQSTTVNWKEKSYGISVNSMNGMEYRQYNDDAGLYFTEAGTYVVIITITGDGVGIPRGKIGSIIFTVEATYSVDGLNDEYMIGQSANAVLRGSDDSVSTGVTWSSSDTSVATIDSNGYINFIKSGTVTFTGSANGKSASKTVIVRTAGTSQTDEITVLLGEHGAWNGWNENGNPILQYTPTFKNDTGKVISKSTELKIPIDVPGFIRVYNTSNLSYSIEDGQLYVTPTLWNDFAVGAEIGGYTLQVVVLPSAV